MAKIAGENTVVIAVEDMATATIVAVEGARVAMDKDNTATQVVLLHVLDHHPIMGAVLGMSGQCLPLTATTEEVEALFGATEGALRAEFEALSRPTPVIRREVAEGDPAAAIEQVAGEYGAGVIVLGARRPHAFGRLVHPDIRAHVATHAPCHVHVAALQETPKVVTSV